MNPDVPAAISMFRQLAATSATALLTEGEVHPDHNLLELCANALDRLSAVQRAQEDDERFRQAGPRAHGGEDAWRAELMTRFEHRCGLSRSATTALRAVGKIAAQTGAGIFAKAQCIAASKTGCPVIAKSLAVDLLNCRPLRAVIWPAGDVDR
jgi:hypothetical protein